VCVGVCAVQLWVKSMQSIETKTVFSMLHIAARIHLDIVALHGSGLFTRLILFEAVI